MEFYICSIARLIIFLEKPYFCDYRGFPTQLDSFRIFSAIVVFYRQLLLLKLKKLFLEFLDTVGNFRIFSFTFVCYCQLSSYFRKRNFRESSTEIDNFRISSELSDNLVDYVVDYQKVTPFFEFSVIFGYSR